jgi:hypothetical protein
MPLVPRRTGDAPSFTISLDRSAIKATSGGWARELTTRQLPKSTGLAAALLFLDPGGSRETRWHNSPEWACVTGGQAASAIDAGTARTAVIFGEGTERCSTWASTTPEARLAGSQWVPEFLTSMNVVVPEREQVGHGYAGPFREGAVAV